MGKVKTIEEELYNTSMMASLVECNLDYVKNWASLYFFKDHCPDMDGAIKFVRKVMPKVSAIYCYSNYEIDTSYHLYADGEWKAKRYSKKDLVL